ncbi:MAG: TCR/Tet family MFS transporter [Saprospiraceae bacterium]
MKKAFIFIFITVLIDVIGLGIIIPVLPELIMSMTKLDLSGASAYSGWLMSSYSIMLFFCAPIMGGLSDQFGRRPIILITLLVFGLDYLIQGFAPTIGWLFFGRIVAGITGASFSVAGSFIADLSEPEKKAQNFGLIGAAFGLGFIIGPLLGSLLGQFGTRVPFFGAAALALINFIFGYFVLPESLNEDHRRAFSWKRANPFGTLKVLMKYSVLRDFVLILFMVYLAHYSLQSTWSFYTMHKFQWDHKMVGYSLAFVGLTMAIVQGGLTRILIPKLGPLRSIYFGFTAAIIGYLGYAFAPQGWYMFAFILPFSLSGLAGPSIQGLISNQVPANAQGELQGGLTSLMSVTAIFGPLIMSGIFYRMSVQGQRFYFPGAPFLLAFFLILIALLLAIRPLNKMTAAKMKES